MTSKNVEKQTALYDDVVLSSITSFEEAMAAAKQFGAEPVSASDVLGNGFVVADAKIKDSLVGKDFFILTWASHASNKFDDTSFVSVTLVDSDDRKLILNDGGAGIPSQLRSIAELRQKANGDVTEAQSRSNIAVPGGLRKSEYIYTDDKGRKSQAVTYYLNS